MGQFHQMMDVDMNRCQEFHLEPERIGIGRRGVAPQCVPGLIELLPMDPVSTSGPQENRTNSFGEQAVAEIVYVAHRPTSRIVVDQEEDRTVVGPPPIESMPRDRPCLRDQATGFLRQLAGCCQGALTTKNLHTSGQSAEDPAALRAQGSELSGHAGQAFNQAI